MGFVIGGFLGIALVVGAVWLTVFLWAHRGERRRRAEEARAAERERLLRTPGSRLHCAGCGVSFAGPIPDDGCPGCHCVAFVTAEPPAATSATNGVSEMSASTACCVSEMSERANERVSVGTGGEA